MQTHDPAVPISKKPFLPAGIVKRDGQRVAFDPRRIAVALTRAGLASGEFDDDEAELLTQRVLKVLRHRFATSDPTVEQVQARILEQCYLHADAEGFVNFYASKGWMVGKSPMKDWGAALAGWEARAKTAASKPSRSRKTVAAK